MSKIKLSRKQILAWLADRVRAPTFEGDDEKTRVAAMLNIVLWATLALAILFIPISLVIAPNPILVLTAIAGVSVTLGVTLVTLRRGQVQAAATLFTTMLWLFLVGASTFGGGVQASVFPILAFVVLSAGLFLGWGAALTFILLTVVAGVALLYAEANNMLPEPMFAAAPANTLLLQTLVFVIIMALMNLSNRSIIVAFERVRAGQATLAERTRELEASQRVTLAASERVSPDELLDLVVNLIRDQFSLYHAQVYFVDEEQQALVLRQSTGYAGRQLMQQRHRIPLHATALVTRAFHTREPVMVNDVSKSTDFMPNPLLTETQSELAVPLILGDKVIGVLDAQDRTPDRFGEGAANLFQSLTDQIAMLFENSELLERITEQTDRMTLFTNQLRTAAEIARRLGTILDPERLGLEVVELLQSRFGLYHAHIYLLNEETGKLEMHVGSGEVGRVLREQGHTIDLDEQQSLVARAARGQRSILVPDVTKEPEYMPNPLLPQTRSEVAVPLVIGETVLGVLDLQDNQPGRFSEADRDTFLTLAGQIAVALQNADLFARTQALYDISSGLSAASDEDRLLHVLARPAMEAGAFHAGLVYVELDEAGEPEWAEVVASWQESGEPVAPVGRRYYLPDLTFRDLWVSGSGQVHLVTDIVKDTRVNETARSQLAEAGIRAMASIPLSQAGRLLGVLIYSWGEPHDFGEREREIFGALVGLAAPAVASQQLLEDLRGTAEQLREVDRLKSEFLASMSHELRTPLNSIIGYTEVLLMGIDSELSPELREDVQSIYDNSQHLLRIINDVLDLAKIEAGRLELDMEEIPIDELVQAASSSIEGLLVNKSVAFNVDIEQDLPRVWGDQVRLHQILNNLTSNAIKFTEEGSITLRAFQDDGWVCLEVEDTGIGISEEDQIKIFERFHQIDGSNAREQEGTGLGLAITRHLVQLHGGTVGVKSKPGAGSTFTVRIPIDRSQRNGPAAPDLVI
jgi:signal transduction histidine kinase/putative methionine-R-sulfoxide reductase with GAF domain